MYLPDISFCKTNLLRGLYIFFSPRRRAVLQNEISGKYITWHVFFILFLSQFKFLNLLAVRISLLLFTIVNIANLR